MPGTSPSETLKALDEDKDKNKILLLIEEMSSQPKYDVSKRSKFKLTDEVMEEIDRLVSENEKHRLAGRSKQQLKKLIFMSTLMITGMMLDIQLEDRGNL